MIQETDHPRPLFRRRDWIDLAGEWEFGSGERPRFDGRILVPFCPESDLSGIGEHRGDSLWYRRRFTAPAHERLLLHFGAVDYRATVWVNGTEVARHEGGHTPFSADITAAVTARENEIVVHAQDFLTDKTIPRGKQHWKTSGEGIFYTPTTGIWQRVWLEPAPAVHVRGLRLRPDLETGTVAFDIRADGPVELVAYLGGEPVARASSENDRGRLRPEMVRPWSPDSPVLYDLEVRLFDRDGRVLDQVESYFGFRTVEAQDGRFRLNGEPFFQRLVLDQGYFPAGLLTAPDGAALKRDIELAKAFGFDGARKHQKIEDPRWLYWADVLGFLVWEEMPGFHEHSPAAEERLAREWAEAVRRDRDHPCIVAWVPFNESFGLDALSLPRRAQLLVRLYELTHELDGSRPVVDNDGWEHALTDLCTLHDYGVGVARPAYLPGYAYRGEPLIVSEFGGVKLAGPGWGYSEARGPDELLSRYASLLDGLATSGDVQGFCYTQLTDVEQERNGLLGFDREPKLEPALVREVNGRIAKCGEKPKNGPYSSY